MRSGIGNEAHGIGGSEHGSYSGGGASSGYGGKRMFELYVISHLMGDYLFQNNWMALNKGTRWLPLVVHSAIYAVMFGVAFHSVKLVPAIFVAHAVLDRLPVTELWLRFIHGRSLRSVSCMPFQSLCGATPATSMIYSGFTTVVYCVVDFLIHYGVQMPLVLWLA